MPKKPTVNSERAYLWAKFHSVRSAKRRLHYRNLLAEQYLPLVVSLANRMAANIPPTVTVDELVSAGAEALLKSIEGFDPARRTKPSTYFGRRLWGAMQDYLRAIDHLPRTARRRTRDVAALHEELGREPTDAEIADRLHVPVTEAQHYRQIRQTISMEMPVAVRHDGRNQTVASYLQSVPDQTIANREAVADAMRGCSQRERQLLTLYYLEGKTMAEVGLQLGLSESRVSQLHSALMARLRSRAAA